MAPGMRARKKFATRKAIIAAATRLFAEHGYDNVTVSDVCETADVSMRTFYRYFLDKEEVVFGEDHHLDQVLADAIAQHPARTVDDLAAVAQALAEAILTVPELQTRQAIVSATPALAAREQIKKAAWQRLVAEAAQQSHDPLAAQVLGGIWRACWDAASDAYLTGYEPSASAAIDDAFATLAAVIADSPGSLRVHRARQFPSTKA